MKIKKLLLLIVCFICTFSLIACEGQLGPQGEKGETGAQGIQGEKGETGAQGIQGEKGETGKSAYEIALELDPSIGTVEEWLESLKGENGKEPIITVGDNGNWFVDGIDTGTKATGAQGEQGIQGEKGDKGEKGETGAQGEQGIQGEKGDKGDKGETGAQGEQGIQGEKGDKGDKGETGSQGEQGLSAYELYIKYHPQYNQTERQWVIDLVTGELNKTFNIIYAVATIPPVLAALGSFQNGNKTYAMIERGKTYYGIDLVDSFVNMGFDANNNRSDGLYGTYFTNTVNTIKNLNEYYNASFNIFVQDGKALNAFAIAANAGLEKGQYNIIILEDGTGAYYSFQSTYIDGKTSSVEDDQIYSTYVSKVNQVKTIVDEILSTNQNDIIASKFDYDISVALPLAALDNVTYWYQDAEVLHNLLLSKVNNGYYSKMLAVLGFNESTASVEYKANVKFQSISEGVNELSIEQKEQYLTLMYGNTYEGTLREMTRSTLSDGITEVPVDKLVFIPGRINSFARLASNATYGIGGASSIDDIPNDYADLDSRFKTPLLFGSEDDYNALLAALNNPENYTDEYNSLTQENKDAVKVACFNWYIDYMFILKYTYEIYGEQYDIIMKGHPRECIGQNNEWTEWTSHYVAGGYTYDKLLHNSILAFHTTDSIGKFIDMVPYGTAAENLPYLGGNKMALGGLNSSTYTGYDTSVVVEFVIQTVDTDITVNSNLNARYTAGTLDFDKDGDGEAEFTTEFINTGLFYKKMAEYYTSISDATTAAMYQDKFDTWFENRVKALYGESANVDDYEINSQSKIVLK